MSSHFVANGGSQLLVDLLVRGGARPVRLSV